MKLFVDDIRNAPDDTWTVARTVTDAIKVISRFGEGIYHISLDHDISHQIVMGEMSRPFPCGDAFQGVAHFIGEYYTNHELPANSVWGTSPRITIHSANPVGSEEIRLILQDYGRHSEVARLTPANRLEMTA